MPRPRKAKHGEKTKREVQKWADLNCCKPDSTSDLNNLAQERTVQGEQSLVQASLKQSSNTQDFLQDKEYQEFLKKIAPPPNYKFADKEEFFDLFFQLDDRKLPEFADVFKDIAPSKFGDESLEDLINQFQISSTLDNLHISSTVESTVTRNDIVVTTLSTLEHVAERPAIKVSIPLEHANTRPSLSASFDNSSNNYFENVSTKTNYNDVTTTYNESDIVVTTLSTLAHVPERPAIKVSIPLEHANTRRSLSASFDNSSNNYFENVSTKTNYHHVTTTYNEKSKSNFACKTNEPHSVTSDGTQTCFSKRTPVTSTRQTTYIENIPIYNNYQTDLTLFQNLHNPQSSCSKGISTRAKLQTSIFSQNTTVPACNLYQSNQIQKQGQHVSVIIPETCRPTWMYPRSINSLKLDNVHALKPHPSVCTTRKTYLDNGMPNFSTKYQPRSPRILRTQCSANPHIFPTTSASAGDIPQWCSDTHRVVHALSKVINIPKPTYAEIPLNLCIRSPAIPHFNPIAPVSKCPLSGFASTPLAPIAENISMEQNANTNIDDTNANSVRGDDIERPTIAQSIKNSPVEQTQKVFNQNLSPSGTASRSKANAWMPVTLVPPKEKSALSSRTHMRLRSRISGDPKKVSFKKSVDVQDIPEQPRIHSRKRPFNATSGDTTNYN